MVAHPSPLGFWPGYALWLRSRRTALLGFVLLVAVAFAIGLWVTRTPEDPFVYGL